MTKPHFDLYHKVRKYIVAKYSKDQKVTFFVILGFNFQIRQNVFMVVCDQMCLYDLINSSVHPNASAWVKGLELY